LLINYEIFKTIFSHYSFLISGIKNEAKYSATL